MGSGGSRLAVVAIAACAGLLAVAPAAQASFHEIMVREVYAGTNNDSYVELQTYQPSQNFVGGHSMTVYNTDGTLAHTSTFGSLPSGLSNAANQMTVLIGGLNTQSSFGVAPDLVDSALAISASGGAACWNAGGIPADCVSWGAFTGDAMLQTLTGTSAGSPVSSGGITSGKAIRRTIAPNCGTLLEAADDTNNSLTDFSEVTPGPRNNASAITETACTAPNTTINSATHANSSRTNDTANSFTFSASPQSGSTSFECKLNTEPSFTACTSPKSYSGLTGGGGTTYTFQVRAIDTNGPDLTPATLQWTVDTSPPTIGIVNHPPDPSSPSASFTFNPSESVGSYQCDLIKSGSSDPGFSSCQPSGQSYSGLADGTYTFKVRATDTAGNQSVPVASDGACTTTTSGGTCTWTVDHLAADKTPPNTFIDTKPPDPSDSSSASFTYHADEPASFECKLDSNPFAVCDPSGITYTGLQDGSHTFQVRATDPSSNTDATSAGYTFTVALPSSTPPPPPPDPDPTVPPPLLPPQTTISLKPPAKTRDRTPTFRFRSNEPGSTFRCTLDRGVFKACRSPFTTKALKLGRHTLKIQAVSGGAVDPSPATFSFKVVKH